MILIRAMKAYIDPYLYDLDHGHNESLRQPLSGLCYLDHDRMKVCINLNLDYDLDHDHDESLHGPILNNDHGFVVMTWALTIWFDICSLSRLSISDDGETAVLRVRPHHSRNVSHIPAGNPFNLFTAFS
jgi:hypothetical protein